ncbi:MAG: lytic transglycosylase domain-containing protein [Rhodobacteraceae bacterium]|jgi:soluble lytic murein transglycosylase-like protein|nr:lytic transglycosylase domain-containing protein [Paracoccaceae bacterium]
MIRPSRRRALLIGLAALMAGCGSSRNDRVDRRQYASETPELRRLIEKHARRNDVPVDLVERVVQRESRFNPAARNGPYYGLMQIRPETARTMGYRGRPSGLLDADTNLTYAVKYLRGAWLVSDGDHDRAVMWYARGYYYEAKRRGLLEETGLRG